MTMQPFMTTYGASPKAPSTTSPHLTTLLSMLHRLQVQGFNQAILQGSLFRDKLRQLFPKQARLLEHLDDHLIQTLAHLFQRIHQQNGLSHASKSNLLRLQVPFLKLLLLDAPSLSKSAHPARQLLYTLTLASLKLSSFPSSVQPLIQTRIDQVIEQIIYEFVDNDQLFTQLNLSFHDFMQLQQQRQQKLEQRQREAAEGQAKAAYAKHAVAKVLQQYCNAPALPEAITHFLTQAWQRVLYLTCLRQGLQSQQWAKQVRIATDLIQLIKHPEPLNPLLRNHVPRLLQEIKIALDEIAINRHDIEQHLDNLQQVLNVSSHVANLQKVHVPEQAALLSSSG